MKIEIRLMHGEDLPQILEIEQSWDYLSKWGKQGYCAVLRDPRVYACFVAEDVETEKLVENLILNGKDGVYLQGGSVERATIPTPAPLPRRGLVHAQEMQPLQKSFARVLERPIIAGFAILALLIDHCELCNLVVRPSYISKKVGHSLLQQCFEVAQRCGIERAFLEVRQSNRRAIEFYEGNGFQITSQRKHYYRNPPEHAWVMERQLMR